MADLNWQFPRDIGTQNTVNVQPYMILTSYESKNAISSVGVTPDTPRGRPISSIALYIPPNSLRQTTDANWEGVEAGALRAGAMAAAGKITGLEKLMAGSEGAGVADWGETITNIFTSAGLTGITKTAQALDKGTGMLSAGAGIAVNNHMAMAYKGPSKFRTHEFAFNFFPKNEDDAVEIKNIINDFQNGMLPRMVGTEMIQNRKLSKPFFQSPRHWDIEFYSPENTLNQFMFKIKKSVITSLTVNHDPNSVVSFHKDGSPVQTAFSLTFQEIELPISGDPATAYSKGYDNMTYQQGQGGSDYVPGNHNYTEIAESGPNKNQSVNNKGQTIKQQFQNYSNSNFNKYSKMAADRD